MNRIRTATVALLLASFVGVQPAPAEAKDKHRRDKYEDRWERRENYRDQREYRRDVRSAYDAGYWDAARHYTRDDRKYQARRVSRNDYIYRGSDNRYYCKRDDGTTGLIVGAMAGGVLGQIIAPGGSKTLGAILGAGGGALIGRAIDDGVECR